MKCPNCNRYLSFKKIRCDACGQDMRMYKKTLSASNQFYNMGLEKARVRDLSGAVIALKKSLQLEKKNMNARNLLGLVYYEMGEIVSALSEWVISKHFEPEDNDADYYIMKLQANPTKLDNLNLGIRKYNQSLELAKHGSHDLAIIQLKKLVGGWPNFIKAQQLLALLYIETDEDELAKKCLYRIQKVDVNNTTALRYLQAIREKEIERLPLEQRQAAQKSNTAATREGAPRRRERDEEIHFEPVTSYKEEKPNAFVFINLIIGIVIGLAVGYFLIVPTVQKKAKNDYNQKINEASADLASKDSKIQSLTKENEDLEASVGKLNGQIEQLEEVVQDETIYDDLFLAANYYMQKDYQKSAEALLNVDEGSLERDQAKAVYTTIKENTFENASAELFVQGNERYGVILAAGESDYSEAISLLEQSLSLNSENVDSIYFLGRCYDREGKVKKAKEYYNRVINDFPDSSRVSEAEDRLRYFDE